MGDLVENYHRLNYITGGGMWGNCSKEVKISRKIFQGEWGRRRVGALVEISQTWLNDIEWEESGALG